MNQEGASRTRKSINNIIFGFANQIITLVLSFISRTIFIRVLGVDYLGINGIFTDVLSLLSMADLGFNIAMVYSLYKPISENDHVKISKLINFYKKIYNIIAVSITVIGIALIPFLKYIINLEKDIPHLILYYLFSLASVVISYLYVYKTSIIVADQKNYLVSKITIVVNFVKVLAQIVILIIFKNYIIYLIVNVITNFLNNYIASKKAEKLYPYIKEKNELEKEDKKSIFENMKSVFLYKLSSLLLGATDNTLISIIVGTVAVGFYSNYLMITNKILAIIQIVFGSLTASIGNVIIKEKSQKRYEIFAAAQSVSFIICGIVVTSFTVIINDFIRIWLGEEFVFGYIVICAIALNMYLGCVLQPLWTYREATGLYVKTKYTMLLAAIINVLLSVALGKIMGIAGILFASVIARLVTYFWYEPYLLFREYFKRQVYKYYLSILRNILFIAVVTTVFNMIFIRFEISSWIGLITKGFITALGSAIIFFVVYRKDEGTKVITNKIKKIFK